MAIKKVIEVEIKDNAIATQDHFNDLRNEIKKTEEEVKDLSKTYGENSKEVKESVKQLNKLQDAYNNLSKEATDLNATFEDIYGDIKPLTARMGEAEDRLYELALAGKTSTQEYKDLLQATGDYKRIQQQTDLVVDAAANTMGQKLGGALQGATSAFAAVQGAMATMGVESEKINEALLKVQGAMALSEGVRGVREAIPIFTLLGTTIKTKLVSAFSTLKVAIIATGIGALVVAIGFAIQAWMEYNNSIEEAAEKQAKLNEEQKKSLELINKIINASEDLRNKKQGWLNDLKREIALIKAKGATEQEIFNKSKEILKQELYNQQVRYETLKMGSALEREEARKVKDEIKNTRNEIRVLEADFYRQRKEKRAEDNKDAKAKADALAKAEKEAKDLAYKEAKEKLAKEIELQDKQYDLLQESTNSKFEQEIFLLTKQYDAKFELAIGNAELEKALEDKQKTEIAEIREKYRQQEKEAQEKKDKAEKEAQEKKIADDKALLDSKYKMTYDTINALIGLNDLFNAKNEKDARRQFKINKALSLAQATIQTFQAVTGALTAGGNPIKLASGVQFIEAGIAAAVGGANIAKIAGTQFGGGGTTSVGGGIPSIGGGSESRAPQFNIVGQGGVGQAQFLEQKPMQAYVVSGEVTSQQALDRNRLRNATL